MKAVIAIDSLKGSLSSLQAGDAIREGILRVFHNAVVQVRPLADGGEGTVEALTIGMGGELQTVTVTGPLGEKAEAQYGILADGRTAIVEMSAAAGITMVPDEKRNPLYTTTYGVGEMIRDAIGKGCRRFIVGIGGSATNDGGVGMLQALGYGMLDAEGRQIPFGAQGLEKLVSITDSGVLPELKDCSFKIACDVTNPLCGEKGCSAIYGPQKGATPSMILQMDKWLADYAKLAADYNPRADREFPGTGAAGGMGFAFLSFTDAVLESGIRIVLEETRLEDYVKDADIVVTGEGRLDGRRGLRRLRDPGRHRLQRARHRRVLPHPARGRHPPGGHGRRERPQEHGRHGRAGLPPAGDPHLSGRCIIERKGETTWLRFPPSAP